MAVSMADKDKPLILHFNVFQVYHLKKIVRLVASMASTAVIIYNADHITLAVTPDSTYDTIVFLYGTSSDFTQYWCPRIGHGRIKTSFLSSHIDSIAQGDVVNVQLVDPNKLCLIVEDRRGTRGRAKVCIETPLGECTADVNEIASVMPVQSRGLVGIPCAQFVDILKKLRVFGEPVSIIVKQHKVKFYVEDHEPHKTVILRNDGWCTFLEVEEDDRIQLSLGHEQISSIMDAAVLTESVWIYLPSPPDPSPSSFMLKFKVSSKHMHVIVFRFTGR